MGQDKCYRVVVAHPFRTERRRIEASLKKSGSFKVIASTGDGIACIQAAGEADLLILDVALTSVDGLGVLSALSGWDHRPKTLLLTTMGGFALRQAGILGADFYMLEPCIYEQVAMRARELMDPARSLYDRRIDDESRKVLRLFAASPKLRGFDDILVGIRTLLENWERVHNLTKEVYPVMGRARGVTWKAAERSLRTLVHRIWDKAQDSPTAVETIQIYFGDCLSQPPTDGVFLATLAQLVASRLGNVLEDVDLDNPFSTAPGSDKSKRPAPRA